MSLRSQTYKLIIKNTKKVRRNFAFFIAFVQPVCLGCPISQGVAKGIEYFIRRFLENYCEIN